MKESDPEAGRLPWRIYLLIGIVGVILAAMVAYNLRSGVRMATTYTLMVNAAYEIKLETTTAHLWLEEILSGDRSEDIEAIWEHLDEAEWFASLLLEGGESSRGVYVPVGDVDMRQEITTVRGMIIELKDLAGKRLVSNESSSAGSDADQQYDALFASFISQTENIEDELLTVMEHDLSNFRKVQTSLIVSSLVLTFFAVAVHRRFVQRRAKDIHALQAANEKLEIAMEGHLQTQDALRRSEEEYRLLIENANEAIVVAQDGMLKFFNPKTVEITGYSPEELAALPFVELIHPDDRQMVAERHMKRLAGEQISQVYKFRILDNSGNSKWVEINAVLITWEGKSATLNFLSDISERVQAEEKLRSSEKRYRSMIEQSPIGTVIYSPDGRPVYVNPAQRKVMGISAEQLAFLSAHYNVLQDQQLIDEGIMPFIEKGFRGEASEVPPILYKPRDMDSSEPVYRDDLWIRGYIFPVRDTSGNVREVVMTFEDITERVRAEKLQEAVYRIDQAAGRASDLDDLFLSIHKIIQDVMPANNFYISLYDEKEGLLSFPYFVDEVDDPPQSKKLGTGLTEYVLRTGESLLCDVRLQDELGNQGEVEVIGTASPIWLGVPLIVENKTIGVMTVQHYSDPAAYGEGEQRMLEFVSSQVAKAIESKQAEAALQHERDRARQYLDIAGVMFVIIDVEQRVSLVNRKCCEVLGYEEEEIIGQNWFDTFLPQRMRSEVKFVYDQLMAGDIEPVEYYENPILTKGREERVIAWHNIVLRGEAGEIIGTLSSGEDISERVQAEQAMKRQLDELTTLHTVATAGSEATGEDTLIERTTQILGETLYPDNIGVLLLDEGAGVLRSHPSYRGLDKKAESPVIPLGTGITGTVAASGQPWRIADVTLEADYLAIDKGMRSELCVPLKVGEQVIGVINAESGQADAFSEADERLLVTLAGQLATAIEKVRLFEESQRRAIHLAALHDIDIAISGSLDPRQVYTTIVERSAELLDCDIANLYLWDHTSEEYLGLATVGSDNGGIVGQRFTKDASAIVPELLETRMPVTIPDADQDPRVQPHWRKQFNIRSLLAVPLQYRDKVTGFLFWADSDDLRQWSQEEVVLAQSLAAQAAIAIENARLHDETRRRLAELSALAEVSSALRDAVTIDEMLPILLEEAIRVIGAAYGSIFLNELGTEELVALCLQPPNPALLGSSYQYGEGITGHVAATGEIYFSENLSQDEKIHYLPGEAEYLKDIRSCISFPLRTQERTVGVMHIALHEQRAFKEEEVSLLTAIAGMAANAIHRTMLREQTERSLLRLDALHTIDRTITSSLDLRVTFNVLLDHTVEQLGVDAAAILLFNPNMQMLEYALGRGFRSPAISRTRIRIGNGHAGRAALKQEIISAPDLSTQPDSPDRTKFLAGEGFEAYYVAPLVAKGRVRGVLEVFHREPRPTDADWLQFLETLAGQAAISIDNVTMFNDLQRSNLELTVAYDATIEGWSRALELHDLETEGHSQRVTEVTLQLSRLMGVKEADLVHVRRGALLHDIGKMGIPDRILNKPGPLSEEEWEIVRKHPLNAYELLSPVPFLRPAMDIPYYHHEKWDGTGYPRGLKGEQIPLVARIFAVVDVWEALRSDRPYRQAWLVDKVIKYIQDQAGSHFDPAVVKVFIDNLSYPE